MSARRVSVTSVSGYICHNSAISWSEDNRISLSTEKGIHILEPQFKSDGSVVLSYHRHFIPVPTTVNHFDDVEINRDHLQENLDRESLYSLMLDRTLSPFMASQQLYKGYRICCWSPKISIDGDRCLLATMTLDHRVEIYRPEGRTWKPVVELSSRFLSYIQLTDYKDCTNPPVTDDLPEAECQFRLLKQRVYTLAAKEMVWTKQFVKEVESVASSSSKEDMTWIDDHFLSLIISMKSGHIVMWKVLLPCKASHDADVLHVFDPGLGQISALAWQQINKKSGLLAVGSLEGQIKIFLVMAQWKEDSRRVKIDCKMVYTIWDEKDHLAVSQIGFIKNADSSYFVLAGKGSYLIGCEFVVADALFIFRHQTYSLGSHLLALTGICSNQDYFLATSGDGCLQMIRLEVTDSGLAIKAQNLNLEVTTDKKAYMGICKSPSGVFFSYVGRILGYLDHLVVREPIDVTIFTLHPMSEVVSLLLSHTGNLSEVVDAMTYIHISMMEGESCPLEFQELAALPKEHLKDRSDYILKLVRWLLKFQSLEASDSSDSSNTDEKLLIVEEELVRRQLVKLLRLVSTLHNKTITDDVRLITRIAYVWLTTKTEVTFTVEQLIIRLSSIIGDALNVESTGLCRICKQNVPLNSHRVAKCPNNHIFGRCCLTLQPCDSIPYSKCVNCDVLALKTDLCIGNRCTFCDGELH